MANRFLLKMLIMLGIIQAIGPLCAGGGVLPILEIFRFPIPILHLAHGDAL